MADGLQSLIPSASPIASQGIDYDELLASGDPAGYMAAKRAGLEYKAPNVTLAPQPAAQSALAAGAGKPQESVAPAATPGPTMGTAASQLATGSSQLAQAAVQPTEHAVGQDDNPYYMTTDLKNPMDSFGQSLAAGAQSQVPATNAPNPQMDSTGAATANVQPGGGAAEDPNQKIIQQTSQMGMDFSKKLSGQTTLAQTEAPMEAQRPTTPLNPMDSQYRPTRWQRFGRGVLGGVEGLARGGIRGAVLGAVDPAAVGATAYGAPNRAFSIAAQQRAGITDVINAKEKQAEDVYKSDTGRAKDVIAGIKDIGTVAAQGQNAQARSDTAGAREDTARVAGQLADIKQQVADFQGQGKVPTSYEATVAAAALEKDPTRKAALNAAAKTMASTELKKFQYKAAADGEPRSTFRQTMIDAATEQIKGLQDKYVYNPRRNQYENPNNPNDILNPNEYTDKKNEISSKLDQQLGQKKMKPLGVRFNPADAGAGKPTGRAAQQAAAAAPATTPQAKRPAPPTPTTPPPDGAADMALGSDGQYHYRDAGKKDLGVVK
jgi:hypothetical protein